MYSSCLAASKFIWRKINSDVWFVQIFLQKMLYIAKPPNFPYTSSTVNMLIMNQFHSFTKETKPSKKRKSNPVKLRSRGGGEGEIGGKVEWRRDQSGEIERRGAAIDKRCGAIVGLELGLWSSAKSLLPLSLRSGLSLSLALSFGSLRRLVLWVSLSFKRERKRFKGKMNL